MSGSPPPAAQAVPGLAIYSEFVHPSAEARLVELIEREPWDDDTKIKRQVQHYGAAAYDYSTRTLKHARRMPAWLDEICTEIYDRGVMAAKPTQVIVNKYQPGEGIGPHTDHERHFGPEFATLSLLSAVPMVFRSKKESAQREIWLAPRSCVRLAEAARYDWTHEIPMRRTDTRSTGIKMTRGVRISVTFRTLTQTPFRCGDPDCTLCHCHYQRQVYD